jgi:uncharacterized protein YodC (DUF2158 family)
MVQFRMIKALGLSSMAAALTMVSACTHREPTSVSGFAVGDTVRLESGGPAMTIERFAGKRDHEEAYCEWFAGEKRKHGHFPLGALAEDDSQLRPARDSVQSAPEPAVSAPSASATSCTAEQAELAQVAAKNGYKTGTSCP